MKIRYTITATPADDGQLTVERTQGDDTKLVASFDGVDLDAVAGIYQLMAECQAQADDAAYWKQNPGYKVDQFSRISNEQLAVIKQLEKDRDTLQRERDALLPALTAANEQLEELRKRKATGDERMAAAYETLRARYVKASDLLELRIDKFMNNKE